MPEVVDTVHRLCGDDIGLEVCQHPLSAAVACAIWSAVSVRIDDAIRVLVCIPGWNDSASIP